MSELVPRPSPPPPRRHAAEAHVAAPDPAAEGGEGLPLGEYLAALRRHLWLIVGAVAVSVAIAAYRIVQEPPRYTAASAVSLVNARQSLAGEIGTGAPDQIPGWYTDPILSQIQVLRSRAVAQAVVDSLGLRLRAEGDEPFPYAGLAEVRVSSAARVGDTLHLAFGDAGVRARLGEARAEAAYGQPLELGVARLTFAAKPAGVERARMRVIAEQDAMMWVIGSMHPVQREFTNVVDIQFTAGDPQLAQRAANAIAASFQNVSKNSAQTQSRRRRMFVEEQLRSTDQLLLEALAQLSAFRRGVRSFSPRETYRNTEAGMADLRLRRQVLVSEKATYDRLRRELESGRGRESAEQIAALAASPEVSANTGIVGLYNQLIRYQTARDSATTGRWSRAEGNPDVVQLDSLIATYRGRLVRAVEGRSDGLQAQIGVLDGVIADDARSIATLPDAEAEEMRLSREVETLQVLVDELRREQQKARIDEAVEAGQVEIVDWALAPGAAVPVGARKRLLFAFLVGLMLGGGGALVLDRLNTRLVRREDAEAAIRAPVIAVIPRLEEAGADAARLRLPTRWIAGRGDGAAGALVSAQDGNSPASQAYRKLRTHLLYAQGGTAPRTLMVTSAAASEGKTTVSANVAATFAQQGLRVVVVDADLRRPRLHTLLAISRTPGLSEVLQGEVPLDDALRPVPAEGMHVITAGRLVGQVSELLGGAEMGRVLRELAARFDVVVIDTPPVLAAADAEILGAQADAVLMVVRAGRTERPAAAFAAQQLRAVGANIVGVVLNDPEHKGAGYGGYGYEYRYYGDREEAEV